MSEAVLNRSSITLEDVAREAGVSTSSVSRYLSGKVRVSDKRSVRIAEALGRLNYQPNTAARTLASGRSETIGILTQDISSVFFGELVKGVEQELVRAGYACIITSLGLHEGNEAACIDVLLARQVDGLIVMGHALPRKVLMAYLGKIPMVVVGQKITAERCIGLDSDYFEHARLATAHLIELGHRRIAFVGGLARHPNVRARVRGYRAALQEACIEYDENLVQHGTMEAPGGAQAVASLLDLGTRFSAVFAANDENALGVRLELHRRGLAVPEKVSLVGFDDLPAASLLIPPLTTVRQPMVEGGRVAARAMVALLTGQPFNECLPALELVIRSSTASPDPDFV